MKTTIMSRFGSLLALAGCLAFAQAVSAGQMTGSVGFVPTDNVTYGSTASIQTLSTANSLSFGSAEIVTFFDPLAPNSFKGPAVAFVTPVYLTPTTIVNGATHPIATFAGFTFTPTEIPVFTHGSLNDVSYEVDGTITGNGYLPTPGELTGSFTTATGGAGIHGTVNGTFTLTAVPDGGATLVMFGLALAGLVAFRSRLTA